MIDFDPEGIYVANSVYGPMRNIDPLVNSVRSFTNWETIHVAFNIFCTHGPFCNSFTVLVWTLVSEPDDLGTDLMRNDETF